VTPDQKHLVTPYQKLQVGYAGGLNKKVVWVAELLFDKHFYNQF